MQKSNTGKTQNLHFVRFFDKKEIPQPSTEYIEKELQTQRVCSVPDLKGTDMPTKHGEKQGMIFRLEL